MILVTGAAGKTGKAVVKALAGRGVSVRALVRRREQTEPMLAAGASQVTVGDLGDRSIIVQAVDGVEAIYHICPNVDPLEIEYAVLLIQEAVAAGVGHVGYHSVLHPQTERMIHHWRKMRVEEALFESGLPFTILQPCAYMQNLAAYVESIMSSGMIRVPYSTAAKLSFVDLNDVAAVGATVLCEPGHRGAIYELAGPTALDHRQIAATFSAVLGNPVQAEQIDIDAWASIARRNGLDERQISALCAMFDYYDRFGFRGNSNVLAYLLGRPPRSLEEVVRRMMAER